MTSAVIDTSFKRNLTHHRFELPIPYSSTIGDVRFGFLKNDVTSLLSYCRR
jgi:hypothetical protein